MFKPSLTKIGFVFGLLCMWQALPSPKLICPEDAAILITVFITQSASVYFYCYQRCTQPPVDTGQLLGWKRSRATRATRECPRLQPNHGVPQSYPLYLCLHWQLQIFVFILVYVRTLPYGFNVPSEFIRFVLGCDVMLLHGSVWMVHRFVDRRQFPVNWVWDFRLYVLFLINILVCILELLWITVSITSDWTTPFISNNSIQ